MNRKNVIPRAMEAFKSMDTIAKIMKSHPCYALIHLDGESKIFCRSTSRQQHKYLYPSPGALKRGLREFLESNVYDIERSKYGWEERNHISGPQLDDLLQYLFDNKIVEIVYLYEENK